MEITEVRVRLVDDAKDRLKAVCTITIDDQFVVRDVKIVDGANGLFVAMPSRKLTSHCPKCRGQNHLRAKFCNECGAKLPPMRVPADDNGREKAHRDVAHPITPDCRQAVQERVLVAFNEEFEATSQVEPESHEDETTGFGDAEADERSEVEVEVVADDEVEAEVEVSSYDALIADLGGRGSRRPEQAERADKSRDERPSSRGGRGRSRSRRDERDDRPKSREPAPIAPVPPSPAPRAPAPVVAPVVAEPTSGDTESSGFGMGLLDDADDNSGSSNAGVGSNREGFAPAAERKPVEESVQKEEPSGNLEETNDENGFGAGLL